MRSVNLFWSTRKLTEAREDHLTEFFAAALAHVPSFRHSYAETVLAPFARRHGWAAPVIEVVQTQSTEFNGTGCQPDMMLTLQDGRRIACEHKLEAPETPGDDERGQLERYLELPIDGLVYVRRGWSPPDATVLSNPRYVRPSDREHYLWSDFFPLLNAGQHVLIDWLREGFEWLGYTPPNPNVGELTLRPEGEALLAMEDFAKLWGRVRSSASRAGWTVQSGSRIQLYLIAHATSPAAQVFISPESRGGFLVRFTPRDAAHLVDIEQRGSRAAASLPVRSSVEVAWGNWKGSRVRVVDVRATRIDVMGSDHTTVEVLEQRLLRFVEPLLLAVT